MNIHYISKKYTLLFSSLLIMSLTACSNNPYLSDVESISTLLAEATDQNGRSCVRQSQISGYGIGPKDTLFIDAFGHGYYVADMQFSCMGLSTSGMAGFKGKFNEICGGRGDSLIVGGEKCIIGDVYWFESREEAHEKTTQAYEDHKEQVERAEARYAAEQNTNVPK